MVVMPASTVGALVVRSDSLIPPFTPSNHRTGATWRVLGLEQWVKPHRGLLRSDPGRPDRDRRLRPPRPPDLPVGR
jgi:hypothetical protein